MNSKNIFLVTLLLLTAFVCAACELPKVQTSPQDESLKLPAPVQTSPLFLAAKNKDIVLLQALIDNDADVHAVDKNEETVLLAILRDNGVLASFFIDNYKGGRAIPNFVISNMHINIASLALLIKAGADVNFIIPGTDKTILDGAMSTLDAYNLYCADLLRRENSEMWIQIQYIRSLCRQVVDILIVAGAQTSEELRAQEAYQIPNDFEEEIE